jgi:predicted component of type VI protein secretion system
MDDPNPPRLWISQGGEAARSVPIAEGTTVIGRGEHCDVSLEDEAISADHLEISRRGPSLMAEDLDSRNGTLLNGEPLDSRKRVRDGDVLQAGDFRIEVGLPPQQRHKATAVAPRDAVKLTEDEREVAVALVADYRSEGVRAPRLATRAEIAGKLHVSERTVQRRIDALGRKLKVPDEPKRERPRMVAERVLELGLDR